MSRFRDLKKYYLDLCARGNWKESLEAAVAGPDEARVAVNPFLALLPRPEYRWQAVYGLGLCLPYLVEEDMESARVFMRRLMWTLNEESGNLGWGVPEAMGAILGASPKLAKEYARIFISYGYETGKDDNFLDHAPLRRGVFWGIGRLAQGNPAAAWPGLAHLVAALADDDTLIRGMAAWALEQLARCTPRDDTGEEWDAALHALEQAGNAPENKERNQVDIELFNGRAIVTLRLEDILAQAQAGVRERV